MIKKYNYIARASAGKSEKLRLAIQNKIFGPGTEEFITPFLKSNMTALIVGCGTGEETCFIAKNIGPTGKVVAIDLDEKQLEQAKIKVTENAITNVEIHQMDLMDVSTLPYLFDFAFSRLVLTHVPDPITAIKCIINKLKSRGRLACEEPVVSAAYSIPKSPVFTRHIELLKQYGCAVGVDFDLGNKLKRIFTSVGLEEVTEQISQPTMATPEIKKLIPMSLAACAKGYLAQGLATESEIEDLISRLNTEIVNNENYVIKQVKVHQVTGLRR